MLLKKELFEILEKKQTKNKIKTYLNYKVGDVNKNIIIKNIIQETYYKTLKYLNKHNDFKFDNEIKFINWLITISAHNYIDYLRKRSKKKEIFYGHLFEISPYIRLYPDNTALIEERTVSVKDIIRSLPKEQQEVIDYIFYKNYSYKDIEEETGVGINTWLGRMRYALINIKKKL